MSRVSYFQRFSQRENHATNNTLLILRTFYEASPFKLQAALNDVAEADYSIGLQFEQQVKVASSIPDAVISQEALKIYIETKLGGVLDADQIHRHIDGASNGSTDHGTTIVLGLTKEPLSDADSQSFKEYAKGKGVVFASTTFSALADALDRQCQSFEADLEALVEDYRDYLGGEGLLDERNLWLPIFPCGSSFSENERFGLYYEPAGRRSKRNYRFIGVYKDKAVRLIGEIQAIGVHDPAGPIWTAELGDIDDELRDRVRQVIEATDCCLAN